MFRYRSRLIGLTALTAFVAAASSVAAGATGRAAEFHLRLKSSTPAANDTLTSSPRTLELTFTEQPEPTLSTVTLSGTAGKRVPVGKPIVRTGDRTSIVADVQTTLAPGAYHVDWRAMSRDGHVVKGSVPFFVGAQ